MIWLSIHFHFERTWWMLFWAYTMHAILSVHDECYFERTWWMLFCAYMMNAILCVHDECYFVRTWWMLFQKPVMHTKSTLMPLNFVTTYSTSWYRLKIQWKTKKHNTISKSNYKIVERGVWVNEWVSEWVLFNANWTIFQLCHGENELIFNEMILRSALH
jgi:hypothetical protein